jgi:hypothetical protein
MHLRSAIWAGLASVIFLTGPARAEEAPPLAAERARDGDRPLLVRPFITVALLSLESAQAALHHPPVTSVGASVGWKRLKLSVSRDVRFVSDDEPDQAGMVLHTEMLNLSLAVSVPVRRRELVLTPFYSSVKGLQVEVDPSVSGTSGSSGQDIVVRNDLRLRAAGVDALYCLNPNFSYDDRLIELKPREHSSGTFLVRASLGRASLGTDGRPLNANTYLGPERPFASTTSFDANYAGASVGAAGQWLPLGHLSLSGQISVGGTLSNAHVALADGTRASGLALRPAYSGYGGIGYVGYTVHAGVFWSYTNEALAIGSDDVTVKRGTVVLYLGLRL